LERFGVLSRVTIQGTTTISPERPDTDDAVGLITELDAYLVPLSPAESRHGYSVEKLTREGVAFFVIRQNGVAAGCGGVQIFDNEYAEIKRMYVRPQFRGLGLAKLMLNHLVDYTRTLGIHILRLETGIQQREAISLYESAGFQSVPPFGNYKPDPLSRFYEKRID
jgi:GNAT superfamily N-acetyltransferase